MRWFFVKFERPYFHPISGHVSLKLPGQIFSPKNQALSLLKLHDKLTTCKKLESATCSSSEKLQRNGKQTNGLMDQECIS